MKLQAIFVFLLLFVACGQVEVAGPEQVEAAKTEQTEIEAEGEARAEAVASNLVGEPAPALTLTTIEGRKIDLGELYGRRPVYLKFWATWCVPCREQMPEFQRIFANYGDRMEVIAVNVGFADDEAAVRHYLTEIDLKMPIAVDDGRLAEMLDLRVTPQHVLIGADGRIAYVGHMDGEAFQQALHAALSGPPDATSLAEHPTPERSKPLQPGDLVGDLSVMTIGGETLDLSAGAGPRGILFFSPWCEAYLSESRPAISEACRLARGEVEKLAAAGDREWLAVSDRLWASESELEQYRKDTQTKVPLALDASGEIFRRFGVRQIPAVALIEDGRLVKMLNPADPAAGFAE